MTPAAKLRSLIMIMLGFLISTFYSLTPILTCSLGTLPAYTTAFFALILIPIVDAKIPAAPATPQTGPRWFFNFVLYFYAIYHVVLIVWAAHLVSRPTLTLAHAIAVTLSTAMVSGAIGITFAHELIHRKSRFERFLAEMILVFVGYGHFAVAHVYGHHRNVATPNDPASAHKDQNVYLFYMQALPGVFREAFSLRPLRTGIYVTVTLMIALAFYIVWGERALIFFVAQALISALLLETVDYIEHYGLKRKELSPGRFEPVRPEHSWDSSARISGYLLVNLQRHADHHMNVVREYSELELMPNVPQLPYGYPTLLLVALVPPLWFRLMNPRLEPFLDRQPQATN